MAVAVTVVAEATWLELKVPFEAAAGHIVARHVGWDGIVQRATHIVIRLCSGSVVALALRGQCRRHCSCCDAGSYRHTCRRDADGGQACTESVVANGRAANRGRRRDQVRSRNLAGIEIAVRGRAAQNVRRKDGGHRTRHGIRLCCGAVVDLRRSGGQRGCQRQRCDVGASRYTKRRCSRSFCCSERVVASRA